MKLPNFTKIQKHCDLLLIILALVVLAVGVIRHMGKMKISLTQTPTIVFAQWWEEDTGGGYLRSLADEFESLHDGIKVIINYMPYEEIMAGFFETTVSGTPPNTEATAQDSPGKADIIALDPLWVSELRPEIPDNKPLVSFISVLFYNIDILKEAGFPRPPKTRNEFLEYTRAICGGDERRIGLAMGLQSARGISDDIYPWIYSAGTRLTRDGKSFVNSRQITESLGFFAALNKESLLAPDAIYANSEKKLEDFISGKAAFMVAPASNIERVRKLMGDEAFSVSAVPVPDNYAGKYFYMGTGWTTGINPASAHREEARIFADFLAGKTAFLSEASHAISGNGDQPPASDPIYSKVWDIAISGEYAQDFAGLPWSKMENVFREELTSLLMEKSSPAEAAGDIQKRWEKITDN